jgi:hypothetical protein
MLSQVGAMEGGDEALSVLPDPGRKASGQASVREEQRGRYQDVLHQEIIQERPARTRHHRYAFLQTIGCEEPLQMHMQRKITEVTELHYTKL